MIRNVLFCLSSCVLLAGCITSSKVSTDIERKKTFEHEREEWLASQKFLAQIQKDFDVVFTNRAWWFPGTPENAALSFYLTYRSTDKVPSAAQTARLINLLKDEAKNAVNKLSSVWYLPHVTVRQRYAFTLRADLGMVPCTCQTVEAILWECTMPDAQLAALEKLVKPGDMVDRVIKKKRKQLAEAEKKKECREKERGTK